MSIPTLAGRIHIPYQGYSRHVALMQEGANIGGAKLWYDRGKQRFFLLVSLTIDTPDPTLEDQRQVHGVDVGQRYLATVATLDNDAQFYSGKEIHAKADHYARLQKRLQRKGTRSATRRRIAIGAAEETGDRCMPTTRSPNAFWTPIPRASSGSQELSGIRNAPGANTARRRQRSSAVPTGMRASGPKPRCTGCSPLRRSSPGR